MLAQDRARLRQWLVLRFGSAPWTLALQPAYQCVLLYRLAHHCWRRGDHKMARLFTQLNSLVTGADIHPHCQLGGGLLIPHPVALTASGHAGQDLTMMPLCGIGMLPRAKDIGAGPGLPVLGDGVWLGAGCGVLGPVQVGDGSRIQAGAALTRDVPPGSLVRMAAGAAPVAALPDGADETARTRTAAAAKQAEADAGNSTVGDTSPATAIPCDHALLRCCWRDLRRDVDRYLRVRDPETPVPAPGPLRVVGTLLTHELMPLALHRLAHGLHCKGWRRLATALSHLGLLVFRAWLHPASCVGGGFFLPHPAGAVVDARAGRELTMYARSLCTAAYPPAGSVAHGGPRLGDGVVIAGMAAAFGPIDVGDEVRIGFNVHLRRSAAAGMSVSSPVMRTVLTPGGQDAAVDAWGAAVGAVSGSRVGMDTLTSIDAVNAAIADRPVPTLADSCRRLREDWARVPLACAATGQAARQPLWPARLCALLFRASHHALRHGHPTLSRWCWGLNVRLTGADMDPRSDIGGGLVLVHPAGVSLHAGAGRNLTVVALATAGPDVTAATGAWDDAARPVLGDGVTLGEHSAVHGAVRLGAGVRLAAGCKVSTDVAAGTWLDTAAPRLHRVRGGPGVQDGAQVVVATAVATAVAAGEDQAP